ncbi:hypothetical protein RUM44_011955 [Polyplax serrata]|uniref:Ig-like domain-containing protein n=1 Tax=Polyplax serrata TaxID=468196 RepID=A0ABR1BE08_POLSC
MAEEKKSLSCLHYSESLKDLRVSVPQAIRKGETAVLMCDFDLEGDSLYSVKWYKGRKEFYRFTPKDEFPIKTFPVGRVNVDVSKTSRITSQYKEGQTFEWEKINVKFRKIRFKWKERRMRVRKDEKGDERRNRKMGADQTVERPGHRQEVGMI